MAIAWQFAKTCVPKSIPNPSQIHPQIQSEIGPRNFRVEGLLSVYMMRVCTAVYGIASDILGENGERGEHEDGNEEDRTGDSTL